MENRRTCDICNFDVHRASFVKHLRSKKHIENVEQNKMVIPLNGYLKRSEHLLRKRYKKYIIQKH